MPAAPQTARGRGRLLALSAPAALAAAVSAVWLALDLRTPDLAAQSYRATLYAAHGLAVWDNGWYAGHHLPGYSIVFPPLGDLIGIRRLGALSAVASAILFAALVDRRWGRRARWGALLFVLAATGDLFIGRITYAAGVTLGLAALLALQRRRAVLAAALAVACAATSPVTGLFLALAGLTLELARLDRARWGAWRPGAGMALLAPALLAVALMALAFPEGGRQPYSQSAFWGALAYTVPLLLLLPRGERTLRLGVALYLIAVIVTKELDTPMGGNVSRLSSGFAGAVLLAAAWGRWGESEWGRLVARARAPVRSAALALGYAAALLALAEFTVSSPYLEARKGYGDSALRVGYYRPVLRFLAAHARPIGRVEIPFTLGHWDATFVGEHFPMARGWERQLDTARDALFYTGSFDAERYRAWLRAVGARWVALPDTRFDPSSRHEARLVASGLPYLTLVARASHWRIYRFTDAAPMTRGPGVLDQIGREEFRVHATAPGTVTVLVHWTPYWKIISGHGCLSRGPDDWTDLHTGSAERLRVAIRFSLGRVLDRGARCA